VQAWASGGKEGARPRASEENFPEGGGATKKRPKISKKYRKIAKFSLFQGRGATEKRPKIALLSLYLLYLYRV